ncbi:MAG: YncE family protein [Opitutus sp.]
MKPLPGHHRGAGWRHLTKIFSSLVLTGVVVGSLNAAPDYQVIARHLIGGDASSYDYLRVDAESRRLYVAHEKRFEVLDADTGQMIGEIGPVSRAHGVALAPLSGHGFASSGIDDLIIMFDLRTLRKLKEFKSSGSNPDSIEYDPASNRVYAANHGSGEVTAIDPDSGEIVGTIKVGGKLEGLAFDGRGLGYANAEDLSAIQVFDTKTLTAKATWLVAPGEGGTGLAVDAVHHRLFSACANKLVAVLDSDSGKLITTASSGEDPDGLAFDPTTGRLFASNPDGTISIIQQDTPDHYTSLPPVTTALGARTIALDPKSGRVITAAPKFGPKPATVKGGGKPRAPILPGTFEVIVVGVK